MTNVLSPISFVNQPATNLSTSSQPGNLSDLTKSFSEILSATLLTGSQTSGAGSSGDTSSVLLPLMLTLLERLLEQQLKSDTAATAPQAPAAAAVATAPQAPAPATSTNAPLASSDAPTGRPVGGVVTNTFHPGHNGIDFGVPVGTPVKATMSGKVVYAGWNDQGYGNLVIVENGPYRTYFAHLSQVPVKVGEVVSSGNVVGISGNTGNSTGPHVHYEVRRNKLVIDPTSFTL